MRYHLSNQGSTPASFSLCAITSTAGLSALLWERKISKASTAVLPLDDLHMGSQSRDKKKGKVPAHGGRAFLSTLGSLLESIVASGISMCNQKAAEVKKEIELEIAHVLFLDIVGYSKLSVNEQHAQVEELNEIVRLCEQ